MQEQTGKRFAAKSMNTGEMLSRRPNKHGECIGEKQGYLLSSSHYWQNIPLGNACCESRNE